MEKIRRMISDQRLSAFEWTKFVMVQSCEVGFFAMMFAAQFLK